MYQQCDGTWSNGLMLEICLDPFFASMNAFFTDLEANHPLLWGILVVISLIVVGVLIIACLIDLGRWLHQRYRQFRGSKEV